MMTSDIESEHTHGSGNWSSASLKKEALTDMKLFKVGVWEENSGFIWVRAKDEDSANSLAGELVSEHGVDRLFDHPPEEVEGSKHTHGNRYVIDFAEEVKE